MEEWKETIIETDVDKLLEYLAKRKEASMNQISEDLNIPRERLKTWAEALEGNNMLEKKYSAREGTILKFTKNSKEELEEKSKEVQNDIHENVEEIKNNTQSESDEVIEAKNKLERIGQIIQKDQKELKMLKEEVQDLEEEEEEIEEEIEEDEEETEEVSEELKVTFQEVDAALDIIQEAEDDASKFEEIKNKVKSDIHVLTKLKDQNARIDKIKKKFKEVKEEEEKAKKITLRIKNKLKSILSGKVICEKCGDVFESKRALNIHKTKKHGGNN